jgi:hypothetical protein
VVLVSSVLAFTGTILFAVATDSQLSAWWAPAIDAVRRWRAVDASAEGNGALALDLAFLVGASYYLGRALIAAYDHSRRFERSGRRLLDRPRLQRIIGLLTRRKAGSAPPDPSR